MCAWGGGGCVWGVCAGGEGGRCEWSVCGVWGGVWGLQGPSGTFLTPDPEPSLTLDPGP